MYKIELLTSAAREFKKLTPQVQREVLKKIEELKEQPFPDGCKKLSGVSKKIQIRFNSDSIFRVRTGNYRVLYTVNDDTIVICIVRIGARKEVYQFLKSK